MTDEFRPTMANGKCLLHPGEVATAMHPCFECGRPVPAPKAPPDLEWPDYWRATNRHQRVVSYERDPNDCYTPGPMMGPFESGLQCDYHAITFGLDEMCRFCVEEDANCEAEERERRPTEERRDRHGARILRCTKHRQDFSALAPCRGCIANVGRLQRARLSPTPEAE